MTKLKVIELFAGIGAQREALKRAGIEHEVVAISEIDKYALKAYELLHGETPNLGDISKIDKLPAADMWTYSFPCFTGDSLVYTKNGYKRIDEVSKNDYVLTHANQFKRVKESKCTGLKDTYRIKGMAFDEIKTTEHHRFYVRKMLRKGHKFIRFFTEPKWIMTCDMERGNYIGMPVNTNEIIPSWDGIDFDWSDGRKTRHKNELQKYMYNHKFWWLIGRWYADGWKRSQGGIIFGIGKAKINEFIEKISRLFNIYICEESTCYKVHIPLKELELFISDFGYGAKGKEIHSKILDLPRNILKSFLDGYLSGDGYYCKETNQWKCTSVSKKLIYGIQQCVAKVYHRPSSVHCYKRCDKCTIDGRIVNQSVSYELAFKIENNKQDKAFYEKGYIWSPIYSVEQTNESELVYDLEVEGDHSFTVQNVIVHNCTDISLAGRLGGFEKGSNTHSSLLWEVQRLLATANDDGELPKFLIMENVKNLISKKFMPLFQVWLDYLSSLGYKNFYQVMNAKNYGVPQNRERVIMVSILDKDVSFTFPEPIELKTKLADLLEPKVDDKYFLSTKLIECFSSMKNRNGLIRGLRFRPHDKKNDYAWTITTCPGSRATDNFIIEPIIVASRGRVGEDGKNHQQLEVGSDGVSNTITTVQKDNYVIVPQATKDGYAIAEVGDGIYTNRCTAKRGVVQKASIPTLKGSINDLGVIVPKNDLIAIRRLTPRECWRLMGWDDSRIDIVMDNKELSNTQLYKMAGNSIVVDVLKEVFKSLGV